MSHTVRRLVRNMRSNDSRSPQGHVDRGSDLRAVREANRAVVLNCIREEGPLARVTIAKRTGLSRTTVSSLVDDLLSEGLVREGSMLSAARSGGRRAILVHFNKSAGRIIGVDLGRTHVIILLTDLAANIQARYAGPFDVERGPDLCLRELADIIRRFVSEHEVHWDQIVGLGLGIPGPIDVNLKTLVVPPRMPGWNGVDIQTILGRELGLPVYVGNDANMGALGESRYGAGRGLSELAYVKIGTGIGCGLVVQGEVYQGSRGTAGELGHVTIDENGPRCDCGNLGCLEAMAGARSIVEDAAEGISLRHQVGGSAGPAAQATLAAGSDVADVVSAAHRGDPASMAAIARAGDLIGIALASLVNLFNPSVILVDGSVAHAGDLLLEPIRRAIGSRSLRVASSHTQILPCELGDNAIALGAVATVINVAFGSPRLFQSGPAALPQRAIASEAGG